MHLERMSVAPSEYVVIDVETNGLKAKEDDLLSIALYKPDDGKAYERFLPLELNSSIPDRITEINGIRESDLRGKKPLSQAEVDDLFDIFELDKRAILHYGALDERFIRRYFERHHLKGYELMKFFNFKKLIWSSSFSGGSMTKDNLCRMFGIEGVTDVHSAPNDCILEWKLFDAIGGRHLLVERRCSSSFSFDNVFVVNEGYIAPASYLANRPNLSRLYERSHIACESELIAKLDISKDVTKQFPNDTKAYTIQGLICSLCHAEKAGGSDWLRDNRAHLDFMGQIIDRVCVRPVSQMRDIAIEAACKDYEPMVRDADEYDEHLRAKITPFVKHMLLDEVFKGADEILSQELVVYEDMGVFALCDLSTKGAVLGIATRDTDPATMAEQLYYQANGREAYLLVINWGYPSFGGGREIAQLLLYRVNPHPGEKPNARSGKAAARIRKALEPQGIELAEYRGSQEKTLLRCRTCGCEWEATAYRATNGKAKCPTCFPKKSSARKPRATSLERGTQFASKVFAASNGIIEVDPTEYKTIKIKVEAHCLKCDHRWQIRGDHLLEKPACPRCKCGGTISR